MIILSLLFFVLAAICNAIMDTLQFHWYKFIFNNKLNPQFWNPALSWKNKYKNNNPKQKLRFTGIFAFCNNFLDAWHIFKMAMIFCFAFSVLFFPYSFQFCIFQSQLINGLLWLSLLGVCWNIPFNLFFNKLLVKK